MTGKLCPFAGFVKKGVPLPLDEEGYQDVADSVALVGSRIGVAAMATPILAHHNITGKFDPMKTRTLKGVVTKLDWANPHVHILMDVTDGKTVTNWAVELESTLDLEKSGWNLRTVKPGDELTVQGMVARNGSAQIWADSVVLTATGKRVLDVSAAARAALLPTPNLPS